MIAALQTLAAIWVTGTLLSIPAVYEALARLTAHDLRQMCPGCRTRRHQQQQVETEWSAVGRAGLGLMVIAAATRWWIVPFLHLCPRRQRCSGPPCAAASRRRHPTQVPAHGPPRRKARRDARTPQSHS